jgi:hypothetical protein
VTGRIFRMVSNFMEASKKLKIRYHGVSYSKILKTTAHIQKVLITFFVPSEKILIF